jgi:hypothetical protein
LANAAKFIERHVGQDADDIHAALLRGGDIIAECEQTLCDSVSRILGNVMKPPVENESAARKRAHEVFAIANKKLTQLRDAISAKIVALEATTLPHPPKDMLGAVTAIQSMEIRTALRAMKDDERIRATRAAVLAGDAVFVHAATNGSSQLSGLSETEQVVARDMWQQRWHPDTLARVRQRRDGLTELDRLCGLLGTRVNKLFAERNASIDAAEKSAQLAQAAMGKSDAA